MAGIVIGFDFPAAFALAEGLGLTREEVATYLPSIEAGMLSGLAIRRKAEKEANKNGRSGHKAR